MRWIYVLELSWKNLMNRKIRSTLTIMGVIIGISAVTFLTALGYGFEKMTTSQVATTESLKVFDVNLDESDLQSIGPDNISQYKNLANVVTVEPAVSFAGKAIANTVKTDVTIYGFSDKYMELGGTRYIQGGSFNEKGGSSVIVSTRLLQVFSTQVNDYETLRIGLEVLTNPNLSPNIQDKNSYISIPEMPVVGVIDDDQTSYIIVPLNYLKEATQLVNYNMSRIQVVAKDKVGETRTEVEKLGYTTTYIGDTVNQIISFFTIFRYIIAGFGFIGMFVAILGMFNTLTVSLLERTREVGILKANGARRSDIWRIFLSEAMIISTVGGVLGLIVGLTIGELINVVFNIYAGKNGGQPVDFFYAPPIFIAVTLFLILTVGFLTGLYPSNRASKISVLDALKYE